MTQTREAFLEERMNGVGGSDVAAVFNISYGCRLRLWREKRGEVPDILKVASGPMDLGNILEPYFRSWYEKITGRAVSSIGIQRHPDYPELFVHPDGLIDDPETGMPEGVARAVDARERIAQQLEGRPWAEIGNAARIAIDDLISQGYTQPTVPDRSRLGVLEIKSMGRGAYYNAKRKGLPEDYVLQLQDAMLVMGLKWGSFAIGCRDFGVSRPEDLLWWDVERDDAVCDEILRAVPIFWAQVENGPMPERLEPDDRRCSECQFRTSCQGDSLVHLAKASEYETDESLRGLVMECVDRGVLKREAQDLYDESREELRAKLGTRTMVISGGVKIQHYSFVKKSYTVPEHVETPLRLFPPREKK